MPDEVGEHRVAEHGYLIADLPDHERPRERLLRHGAEALSITELLAIVLKTGRRGQSAVELARELLGHFGGSLVELAAATPAELQQVRGIKGAKACELKATFELARRVALVSQERQPLSSPAIAAEYLRVVFRGKKQEELHCLVLDNKNGLLHDAVVTVGLLDSGPVHAREVFRAAIQHSAAKVLVAHNHPSGDPNPSAEDQATTQKLVAAGKIIGIEVVDHLVLGHRTDQREQDFFSFREHGLLEADTPAAAGPTPGKQTIVRKAE